ncbi:MAG: L,D-transpeptidase catalytic domain-containing protein [Candidatus Tokpelaia hoelldobleri]|uniref:L,D-transpeptidase catalytic domain-containing protein n=1 Tax=Candidatus Tokpelaia hoelldobleri TaxID=1902579 RepID=A0A1U9JSP0_9HYPH|nr:MAG: L,D-transpeptidase catalytic domain-containing protein [Candidatus Tokpelaia hoelldoblerii]
MKTRAALVASLFFTVFALAACQGNSTGMSGNKKAMQPLPRSVHNKMAALDMPRNSPIVVRIFKEENTLEVWKQKRNGRYDMIANYDICKWSGKLGPKFMEGDRQAPEGFYTVTPAQMNPNSNFYLSFNIGFPNAYDRAHGRTGQHLMVHGACSSAGCYSMTDENIAQIYAFGRDSFLGGQREFQVQAYPFRMTAQNMARYRADPNYNFWSMLKQGYDTFETTRKPPQVAVCDSRYVFNTAVSGAPTAACPSSVVPVMAYSADKPGRGKAPAPSIAGTAEARLVADWSRRRARGERVSREPPSLSPASREPVGAPDIEFAGKKSAVTNETTASTRR